MKMSNFKKKICVECECEYVPHSNRQLMCDKCRSNPTLYNDQFYKRKKKRVSSLDERVREADARGMSYGKYVSLLYDQAHKQRGKKND